MAEKSQNSDTMVKNAKILKSSYQPLTPHHPKPANSENWTTSPKFLQKTVEKKAVLFGILGIVTNVLGFVFGFLALKNVKEARKLGSKAKSGTALGILAILCSMLSLALLPVYITKEKPNTEASSSVAQFTAPGTQLSLGGSAVLPYIMGKTDAVIALSIQDIARASFAEILPLNLGDKLNGMRAYYVNYEVTKLAGNEIVNLNLDNHLRGTLNNGTDAQSIIISGNFSFCPPITVTEEFSQGETIGGCKIILSPENNDLRSVRWQDMQGNYGTKSDYVVWK